MKKKVISLALFLTLLFATQITSYACDNGGMWMMIDGYTKQVAFYEHMHPEGDLHKPCFVSIHEVHQTMKCFNCGELKHEVFTIENHSN